MKLIEPKAELVLQQEGLEGVYKQIELAGRTAYHSLDKITPDSAKSFVDRMIKSKHGAALEHGTVYLKIPYNWLHRLTHIGLCNKYIENPYSRTHEMYELLEAPVAHDAASSNIVCYLAITTNLRVLVENDWLEDLKYICEPTQHHEKRYTIRFICSRAIAQELTRHRAFSFLMESQRYVNYSKEKHGGEITFIIPSWFQTLKEEGDYKGEIRDGSNRVVLGGRTFQLSSIQGFDEHYMCSRLAEAENAYFHFLKQGYTPQQARDVLPNATKTELIMTGFASDWRFFFDLRYYGKTGKPHPDMDLLAGKARDEFIKADVWGGILKYPSKFDKDINYEIRWN